MYRKTVCMDMDCESMLTTEEKNRVDKMAQYKVRNGDSFEAMIKERHKNDPKFAFLFKNEVRCY